MLTKRTKLILVLSLVVVFLLGIVGGISIKTLSLQWENNNPQQSRRIVWVKIEKSQWNELFDQLRKFSDKWRYAIRIAPLDPNGDRFIVDMWRADMRLTAFMDNIYDPGMVQVHFYDTDRTHPVPDSYYDEEISDLKSFLSGIPNVTITEEK